MFCLWNHWIDWQVGLIDLLSMCLFLSLSFAYSMHLGWLFPYKRIKYNLHFATCPCFFAAWWKTRSILWYSRACKNIVAGSNTNLGVSECGILKLIVCISRLIFLFSVLIFTLFCSGVQITKAEALSMSEAEFLEIEEDIRTECVRYTILSFYLHLVCHRHGLIGAL